MIIKKNGCGKDICVKITGVNQGCHGKGGHGKVLLGITENQRWLSDRSQWEM